MDGMRQYDLEIVLPETMLVYWREVTFVRYVVESGPVGEDMVLCYVRNGRGEEHGIMAVLSGDWQRGDLEPGEVLTGESVIGTLTYTYEERRYG